MIFKPIFEILVILLKKKLRIELKTELKIK